MLKRLSLLATLALGAAQPLLAEEVNIYSSRQPQLINPILEAFSEHTGIDVNVVFIKSGMIERLRAEGKRTPADVVLTVDIANLAAIADSGVTQPVHSGVIDANIPPQYRDPDGLWSGLTMRSRVVFTAKDRVDASQITAFEDLADPKWKGTICVRSGLHNYNVALVAAMIAHHGEAATEDWLRGLKANLARRPQGNDRAQIKAVWAGECDIAIANTYYLGEMLQDPEQAVWANSVNLVFATVGGQGAHVNLSGMAMTKSAPHREAALQLMEYLTSEPAQKLYAELNYEYPLLASVKPGELVQSWGEFTPDPMPMAEIAKFRPAALKLIEKVDFDG